MSKKRWEGKRESGRSIMGRPTSPVYSTSDTSVVLILVATTACQSVKSSISGWPIDRYFGLIIISHTHHPVPYIPPRNLPIHWSADPLWFLVLPDGPKLTSSLILTVEIWPFLASVTSFTPISGTQVKRICVCGGQLVHQLHR